MSYEQLFKDMTSENLLHELATETLGECRKVLDARGNQHGNTLGSLCTPFLDNTLREMGISPDRVTNPQIRKLFLAALCDLKVTRIALGWSTKDSALDLINYEAAWCQLDASQQGSAWESNL